MPHPVSIRTNNTLLPVVLAWLRDHDRSQSEHLRQWLETGFALWVAQLAVTDPALYTELLHMQGMSDTAPVLHTHATRVLTDMMTALVDGLGLTAQGQRSATPEATMHDVDDGGDTHGMEVFLDIGDDFGAL